MEGFTLFADTFLESFVRPYQLNRNSKQSKEKEAVIETCITKLGG